MQLKPLTLVLALFLGVSFDMSAKDGSVDAFTVTLPDGGSISGVKVVYDNLFEKTYIDLRYKSGMRVPGASGPDAQLSRDRCGELLHGALHEAKKKGRAISSIYVDLGLCVEFVEIAASAVRKEVAEGRLKLPADLKDERLAAVVARSLGGSPSVVKICGAPGKREGCDRNRVSMNPLVFIVDGEKSTRTDLAGQSAGINLNQAWFSLNLDAGG